MTPRIRRSEYSRESQETALQDSFDDFDDAARARRQPGSPASREVLAFTSVRRSVGADQSSSPHGGGRPEDQGQGPSLEVGGLGFQRLSLGDPLDRDSMPPLGG